MNRSLTDKERILQLEARIAELTDELDAWRANDVDDGRTGAAAQRFVAVRSQVFVRRPAGHQAKSGYGGAVVRLLIRMIDNPGKLLSRAELWSLCVRDLEAETSQQIINVRITYVRDVIQWCGLPRSAVENVWGGGYRLRPDAAAPLKAALEPEAA